MIEDYSIWTGINELLLRAAKDGRSLTEKELHHFDILYFELIQHYCGIEQARQVFNIQD